MLAGILAPIATAAHLSALTTGKTCACGLTTALSHALLCHALKDHRAPHLAAALLSAALLSALTGGLATPGERATGPPAEAALTCTHRTLRACAGLALTSLTEPLSTAEACGHPRLCAGLSTTESTASLATKAASSLGGVLSTAEPAREPALAAAKATRAAHTGTLSRALPCELTAAKPAVASKSTCAPLSTTKSAPAKSLPWRGPETGCTLIWISMTSRSLLSGISVRCIGIRCRIF